MKRADYERNLARTTVESLETRYMRETSRLDALLSDLHVRINLYQEGGLYLYRILDADDRSIIDGLNPAYANEQDYRRIVLQVRETASLQTCKACAL